MFIKSLKEDVELFDIIDPRFLQEFQNSFAKSINIASVIVDNFKIITEPSNITELCEKYSCCHPLCNKDCTECYIRYGKLAAETKTPSIYKCNSGLTYFAVPIMLNDKHVGSIICGQVLTQKPDFNRFKQIAKELNVDEAEYLEALSKIKIMTFEQIKATADLLFIFANFISQMALKNCELRKKQQQKDDLLNNTIEIIRESSDVEEIKNYYVNAVSEYFKPDRTLFVDFNQETQKFTPFLIEKLKSPDVKSLLGVSVEDSFPEFAEKLKTKKRNIIIKDLEKTLSRKKLLNYRAIESLSNSDAKSDYGLIVLYKTQIVGILIMHFTKNKRVLTSDELNFLKTIRNQVGIALYQANLIKEKQQIADNEKTLRHIMLSSPSFNYKKTINTIVTQAGEFFKADRCFYIGIDFETVQHNPIEDYAEYLSSDKIRSHRTRQPNPGDTVKFINGANKDLVHFVDDITKIDLPPETKKMLIDDLSVKSYLVVYACYDDIIYGSIVLHYVNNFKKFTQADIDMGKAIAHHAAIIIHQTKLYEAIQRTSEREKAILNNMPFMVWLKDKEGKFLAINEPFAAACGKTSDSLVGKTDYDIWSKELADNYAKDDLEIMQNGKTRAIEELIQSPDGAKWHETHKTPLLNEKGEIIGITGFSRDITERKEVDRMKSEFVSTVSHELRTPLTSLSGALELLLSGKIGEFSEKIKSLLEMAHNNSVRLTNLINDILDIEKIEAGKMDFAIEIQELAPLIEQAIKLNFQYAQKFNVEINLVKPIPSVLVQVDSSRLIQVLTNLLSNAVKFSEPQASVEVEVVKGDNVRVSVTNYGAEISQDFKGRIFQKFAQADSSDSRKKGGTGLGLSISKLIIEKMNGQIKFVSENNKTTFYFELPEGIEKKELYEKTRINM